MAAGDFAKALFEAYDRYRLRDVYDEVDRGASLAKQGKASEAAAVFDDVLGARAAHRPDRHEMVPAYADLAAGPLGPPTPRQRAPGLQSPAPRREVAWRPRTCTGCSRRLEGEAPSPRASIDIILPGSASPGAGHLCAAHADLDRLRAPPTSPRTKDWRLYAAAAVLAAAIAGVLLLGGRTKSTARA